MSITLSRQRMGRWVAPSRRVLVPAAQVGTLLVLGFAAFYLWSSGKILPRPLGEDEYCSAAPSDGGSMGEIPRSRAAGGPGAVPIVPIADPQRLKRLLPVGSTHVLHTKGGMAGKLQFGFQWGFRRQLRAVYAFESLIHRTIESNDGSRIVEVRHFDKVRMVRLLSEANPLELRLGPPEQEILESFANGTCPGTRKVDARILADAILAGGAKAIEGHTTNRAYLQTDSLSGKTVRITYVDGVGVVSVEPIDCTLPDSDRQFLKHTPVLADAYLAPRLSSQFGEQAGVDARQLASLLAPSLRKIPRGQLQLEPVGADQDSPSAAIVRLFPEVSLPPTRMQTLPTGVMSYDPENRRIHSLLLQGSFANFEGCRAYPEECHWHMSMYPRRLLTLQLCYCCEPGGTESGVHEARSHARLARQPAASEPRMTHAAGLGWQGAMPMVGVWDDLGVARLILLIGAIVCLRCGVRIARWERTPLAGAVVVAVVAATFLFGVLVHGQLWLARWAPVSNIIVLGNFLPLGAAFLIGVLGGQRHIPVWRRATLILFLAASAGYSLANSFPAYNPATRHLWSLDGVSLQTGSASCSACAAATLLADYGVATNEQEMAELCLTKPGGTPILGLFRGLKLKARQAGWDAEVIRCGFDELRREGRFPVLLPVRVGELSVVGSCEKRGRVSQMQGRSHAIVLFGFTPDGRAELGDPSRAWDNGRVLWTADELEAAYCGEGIRLVKR